MDRVQGLVPVAPRPPALHEVQVRGDLGLVPADLPRHLGEEQPCGGVHAHPGPQRPPGPRLALDGRAQGDGAAPPLRHDRRADPVPARRRPGLQPDRTGDPAGHQHRPPVPSEVAGHLAERVVRQLIADVGQVPLGGRVLARHPQRGVETDLERVLARAQVRLDGEAPRAVLVLHLGHLDAVQHHGRRRVEGVRDEIRAPRRDLVERERGAVQQVALPAPGELVLVPIQVRIGDQPGLEQIGEECSRHRRRKVPDRERDRSVDHREGPVLVQISAGEGHARSSSWAR